MVDCNEWSLMSDDWSLVLARFWFCFWFCLEQIYRLLEAKKRPFAFLPSSISIERSMDFRSIWSSCCGFFLSKVKNLQLSKSSNLKVSRLLGKAEGFQKSKSPKNEGLRGQKPQTRGWKTPGALDFAKSRGFAVFRSARVFNFRGPSF